MTLHQALVGEMLAEEVMAARRRLGDRVADLFFDGTDVLCQLTGTDKGNCTLRLAGRDFDGEPFRVAIVGGDGAPLDVVHWPGALCAGVHPVLQRPFACVRGTYEYHVHPSHLNDPWDAIRYSWRMPQLLDHLVKKAGK